MHQNNSKEAGSLSNKLKGFANNILFVLFAAMVVIVFVNVIARFVFHKSITSSEEIARICFIWLVFIGTPLALVENEHLGFDTVVTLLSSKTQKWVQVLANVLLCAITAVITVYGVQLSRTNMSWPAPATGIPYGIIGAIVPISAACMFMVIVKKTVDLFKK